MAKRTIEQPDIQRAKFLSELTDRIQYWTLNSNEEYVQAYMTLLCAFSTTSRIEEAKQKISNEAQNEQ